MRGARIATHACYYSPLYSPRSFHSINNFSNKTWNRFTEFRRYLSIWSIFLNTCTKTVKEYMTFEPPCKCHSPGKLARTYPLKQRGLAYFPMTRGVSLSVPLAFEQKRTVTLCFGTFLPPGSFSCGRTSVVLEDFLYTRPVSSARRTV